MGGSARGPVDRIRRHYGGAVAGANLAGAVVVFVLLTFVLPRPGNVHDPGTVLIANAIAFGVYGATAFPLVWLKSARLWSERTDWLAAGREPSDSERAMMLRYPLSQQAINASAWAGAAVVFTALNAPFSGEVAWNVAITIVLGGLVTCALSYLVGERLRRPLAARALAGGVPQRPQLPGVAARALLAWTLGTGVILLGLVLVGVGGLHERRFTAERLSISILVLSGIGIVVGLAMTIGLAKSLSDRIMALRRVVGRVEAGEFEEQVEVDDASELGLLQAGVNRMVAGLRERERIRDLFGRQVGEDVVRHALEHGVELGGEARDAAVLFVDIQGSTRLAETRDPADVVKALNAFFAIVVEVVAAHEGWVNKFEGDAALCVFGAPLPDERGASNALAAARELRERLGRELADVRAGIGVSAGRVVAGNLGAAKRFEYTVIGDPVNEASRLSDLAKSRRECVVASSAALSRASAEEAGRWRADGEERLRGRSAPTRIAVPA
jgi:adenylate cyclase